MLSEQEPETFTLVVFYRGVHCPMCRAHVTELDAQMDALAEVGVTAVIAVSSDDETRARDAVDQWGIAKTAIGYGQSIESMREWGLYVSRALKEGQPNAFGEPAMFLVRPDGTLYAVVQTSMPFLRPHLDELVETVRWINANDYPARGEL